MKGQNHYGQSLFGESVNRKKYSSIHRFTHSPLHPFTDKGGFTLIETIMVMVIAVILAAVIFMRWDTSTVKLNNATRKVAADIRYTQKLAISTQTRAAIYFNTNGYEVYQNYASIRAQSPGDPCSTGSSNNFIVDFNDSSRCDGYSGVTITSLPDTNPIAFDSFGMPVNSGTGAALTTQTVILSVTKTITIEEGTGRVNY